MGVKVVCDKKVKIGDRQIILDAPSNPCYIFSMGNKHHAKVKKMARIPRLLITDEPAVYHIISRTALDGYVIGDAEKDYLFSLIKQMSMVYFVEVLGYCLMGNHFHLLVRTHLSEEYTDEEIRERFKIYYGEDSSRRLMDGQISYFRSKWENLSEYVKDIKQKFSRYYNKKHNRRGYFWADRFKSVLVENGDTLINCLAYIDLNPVRAGIVDKPEDYRWCSLGYHAQTANRDDFLSLDLGVIEFGNRSTMERYIEYRAYVYAMGRIDTPSPSRDNGKENFCRRIRYFTDSGIIGSKDFVAHLYHRFKSYFSSKEKQPHRGTGVNGMFSLKRLSERS